MEEYYDGVVSKPDLEELYHHQALGAHWGIMNGPPYPLSRELSTGKRLKPAAKGVGKVKKKAAKASVKAAKANKKAAQASNTLLHPIKSLNPEKYQVKAYKAQAKADALNAKVQKMENKEAKREAKAEAKLTKEQKKLANMDFDGEKVTSFDKTKGDKDAKVEVKVQNDFDGDKAISVNKSKDDKYGELGNRIANAYLNGDEKALNEALKEAYAMRKETKGSNWVDDHTKTLESRPGKAARIGEIDHEGNIIRTNQQAINESVWRGMTERNKKLADVADVNQDMFNDMLERTSWGPAAKADKGAQMGMAWRNPEREAANKEFDKEIKRVAKEYGVNKNDLKEKVLDTYEKRSAEISKLDAQRQEQKLAQQKNETINRRLQNAKTRDQWDLNFLEATQNASWEEAHTLGEMSDSAYKNKMLQEYKKYLEDPEKYWKNR